MNSEIPPQGPEDHEYTSNHQHSEIGQPGSEPFSSSQPLETGLYATDASALDAVPEPTDAAVTVQTPEAVRAHLRERCTQEVRQACTDIEAAIAAGTFAESGHDPLAAAHLLSGMAVDTALSGNMERADATLDMLLELPGTSAIATIAKTCYRLGSLGSQHAYDTLNAKLSAELHDGRIRATAEAIGRADGLQYLQETEWLQAVIKGCEEQEVREGQWTPPDTWIKNYAVNDEHQWKLQAAHHNSMLHRGTPDAAIHQESLEWWADRLATADAFKPDFVYEETGALLQGVKDPELREQLVENFVYAGYNVPLNSDTFDQLTEVGSAILHDPALANPRNVELFEDSIANAAEALREAGMDPFELARVQLKWHMSYEQFKGAAPEEFVTYLGVRTGELLSYDLPESAFGQPNIYRSQLYVMRIRDEYLDGYAREYASAGNFAAACRLMNSMNDTNMQEYTAVDCLSYATDAKQVSALKPDDLTMMRNPKLGLHLAVAEALAEHDPDRLAELARDLAATTITGSDRAQEEDMKRVYQAVAGQPNALDVTRTILDIYRDAGATRLDTEIYSEALIRLGDPDEPHRAYEEINRHSPNATCRLRDLWKLERILGEV